MTLNFKEKTNFKAKTNLTGASAYRGFAMGIVSALAVAASGCSMDDVQLNGKIFDAVGLNTTGSVHKGDPKVAERQPLVVPPSTNQLPVPGSEGPPTQGVAGLQDYDAKTVTSQADLERQQAAYCKVHYEEAMQRGDNEADQAAGPLGPCRGSIFSAIKKWNSSDSSE